MTEEIKRLIRILEYISKEESASAELSQDGCKNLLNYITNLQKENEDLLYEINGYLEEKERLKKKITFNEKSRRKMQQSLMEQIETYKLRNEKAVEYIKEWWYEKNTRDINRIVSLGDKRIDLYNILQGGDE